MISAIQSALSGLNAASLRLNQAALDFAQGTTSAAPANGQSVFGEASAVALVGSAVKNPFAFGTEDTLSFASDLLAFKEAEILYSASASLIASLGRLESSLLDITV